MIERLRAARLLPLVAMVLIALAILLGLGTWQWQRRTWKQDLVQTITARTVAAPIDAADWLRRDCRPVAQVGLGQSCEYLAVRLTGTFDHANERRVYTGIKAPPGGIGGQGFWIVTPFRLAGTGEVIPVSRGFVPEAKALPATREAGQVAGETTLVGLVREAEARATFTPANDPAKNMFFLRNPVELFAGSQAGGNRLGSYVEVLSPAPPGGLPQPTAGRIDIPNRHFEYALTWWGLALTLIGVFAVFARERLLSTVRR